MFQFVKKRCRFHLRISGVLVYKCRKYVLRQDDDICHSLSHSDLPDYFHRVPNFFPPISPSCCFAIFFPNFPHSEINFDSSLRHCKRKLFVSSLRVLIFSPPSPLETSVRRGFNDFIGFAGPLLLNKLIRFLQQGSGNLDGYVLTISLGLVSVVK
ncbi:ABC transporter C family member 13 isoform X3 [Gossypium australe]|uniref:ABC transporter C family member 13 isoform X3 n=1 Tax=Gossypium australe TaxID=47621 RepID=A0A5B6UVH6_9ROSI|nr:ABC transporter C family member 13 isoform X3 [Gossypium australe]